MKTIRFWAIGVFLIGCAITAILSSFNVTEARAQTAPQCTDYKTLQAALAEKAHEAPVGAGVAGDNGHFAVTLFSTPKGETWTLVLLDAKGTACIIGAGSGWTDLSPGKGDPT